MKSSATVHLIIMTRLPQAGQTKTRLIPALGAEGSAALHDRLARHTIGRAKAFCSNQKYRLIIRIAGGSAAAAQEWLGEPEIEYAEQSPGTLGDRLIEASESAFGAGAELVLVIGTDCPSINQSTYTQALEQLETRDLILGPAEDGGYYLIGFKQHSPALFQNINWSTETVLKETKNVAKKLGLSVGLGETFPDVDIPEDLPHAERELERGI